MGETNKKDFELTKEVEIDGVKYKFQRLPVRAAIELRQGWQDENGNAIATKMHDAILEHIVIEPKGLTIDDFNLPAEVEKVTGQALAFQYGGK